MKNTLTNRRSFVTASSATLAAGVAAGNVQQLPAQTAAPSSSQPPRPHPSFRYCLNTSTINGSQVPLRKQLEIAATAGYDAVELWLRDIQKFLQEGGQLADLQKELRDLGLGLDSAIAFGNWIVDDPSQRAQGLEQCRRDMDTVRELGGRRIAAPPSGATNEPKLNLDDVAERYRALLDVGRGCEVTPQVELWGFSQNLSTLAELLYVAAAAQHPDACLLLDVYHLYKGGNDFCNMGLVPAARMPCLHMNDYPATPIRPEIGDKDRVYPGDGVAPLGEILRTLVAGGFAGTLSLELFNRDYWQQAPLQVATTGLEKMKATVQAAFA
ncbi:MAG: TIM barrel protein [Planctomycetales bacterium]|nr:TIM barrel protein [Planctomycetales bacterium]